MNIYAYLGAFILAQFWTIAIHDRAYFVNNAWINGAAHQNIHHLEFNYNYEQYFTLWDRIGGSYSCPDKEFENMFFGGRSIKFTTHGPDTGANLAGNTINVSRFGGGNSCPRGFTHAWAGNPETAMDYYCFNERWKTSESLMIYKLSYGL